MPGDAQSLDVQRRPLRLLCLHGHGGYGSRLCDQLRHRWASVIKEAAESQCPCPDELPLHVQLRCVDAQMPETSRRSEGRQWWRYCDNQNGDRPEDFAELEFAATWLAKELERPDKPYDGLLGFSQGSEMVHTAAVLHHRGDPRFIGAHMPRFGISLSGAVNPAHYEAVGGGGPPDDLIGVAHGPSDGEMKWPMLCCMDLASDGWYSKQRLKKTFSLYADSTIVEHQQSHAVPTLSAGSASAVRAFLVRFLRE